MCNLFFFVQHQLNGGVESPRRVTGITRWAIPTRTVTEIARLAILTRTIAMSI